jgi:hypothetical protein
MSEQNRDTSPLERRSKAVFDDSVEGLDGQTRARLARARNRALARGRRDSISRWLPSPRALLPVGATAVVALVALVSWRGPAPESLAPEVAALQDLEMLLAEEELEMLEELEFYTWLEEQPEFSMPEPGDDGVG